MPDLNWNVEELAASVFLARHFCTSDPVQIDPAGSAAQARLLMQLQDLRQAPVEGSNGRRIVLRGDLEAAEQGQAAGDLAINTPAEHWIEAKASLRDAIEQLGERGWLLVQADGDLLGTLNRQDLGRPIVSTYLFSVILDIERGLRRLYGSYAGRPIPDEPRAHSFAGGASQPGDEDRLDTFNTTAKYVRSCQPLIKDLQFSGSKNAKSALYEIKSLRDHLAHARSVLEFGESPADVLGRIQSLESLAGIVRNLLLNREAVWGAYASTIIVGGENTSIVFAGPGADELPMPTPVHVISAQNPYEQFLGQDENARRTEILRQYLQATPGVICIEPAVGRSVDPNATWKEECWAVSGLTRLQAVEIATNFQQRAIFELSANDMLIVSADGITVSVLPRRSD